MCARLICGTSVKVADLYNIGRMTIDVLPEVVLLEIFDYYVNQVREEDSPEVTVESWRTLVHVCQHWRNVVFGSPRRLNFRLLCTPEAPVRKALDVWQPSLRIIVQQRQYGLRVGGDWDNVVAALEHNDRVCEIDLFDVSSSHLETALAAMPEAPFPELTRLKIRQKYEEGIPPVVLDSIMDGSAPRLRYLDLTRVPFPGLPALLSSATHLVHLHLCKTPHSGYISPEAMVLCLSALTSLECLSLEFLSSRSRPQDSERQSLPPATRSVLPSLTSFVFNGVSVYLEDFVARFDAPLLDNFQITFFHPLSLDNPQLVQFISRTPNFMAPVKACVFYSSRRDFVQVMLPRPGQTLEGLGLKYTYGSDGQLSTLAQTLAQVFSSSIPQALISTVEYLHLYSEKRFLLPLGQNETEISQWLDFLNPFTAVKGLYLSQDFVTCIEPALQELVGERAMEVLPALQYLFLEQHHSSGTTSPIVLDLGKAVNFVDARQLAEHPIAVTVSLSEIEQDDGFETDDSSEADDSSVVDD